MARDATVYASQLRLELGLRNRRYARGWAHVESYGSFPVIVYAPEDGRHGNFFDAAYAAIGARPEWMRRFDKVHAQGRSLPKTDRRWRELDSSMSSDALLMNVFCTPGIVESTAVQHMLGVEGGDSPVFERELLPRVERAAKRSPFPAEFEEENEAEEAGSADASYAGYQLIRNVLAAYAEGCSFCVVHDERRPDLREAWFRVMAAVKPAELRVRLKVLTWQELAAVLPEELQVFLDCKYGIVGPGKVASPVEEMAELE